MFFPPKRFENRPIRHMRHAFATGAGATVLVTAPGTGLVIVPTYMAWRASAAGSITLTKGSGGASAFGASFQSNGLWDYVPWWDDGSVNTIGANTSIEITKATGCGAGEFNVWYVIVRLGAGDSGTGQ